MSIVGINVWASRALRYWQAFRKALPEWLDFQGRMTMSHQNNASDPFNAALNYGYGFLEAECRMAINAVGLESAIGFLHEVSSDQTRESLVYDAMDRSDGWWTYR